MKRILMIAHESERWGPARLPQPLANAGLEIAVLCSDQNPLCQSSFVTHHYKFDGLKSSRSFGKTLGRVMADWKPDLVIPCDEPIAVMLHHFLKNPRLASRYLSKLQFETLQQSIGHLDKLDTMILKYQTRLLAESMGIPVPKSRLVTSAEQAADVAEEMGFPVFLKKSFSWAGQGSIRCKDRAEAMSVFQNLNSHTPWYKQAARRLLGRNWFPVDTSIEVQKEIEGESVMYSVAAMKGKVLTGLFGSRSMKLGPTGPSTVVEIGEHATCKGAAEKMVTAMGASGFLAFDFMRCAKTGDVFLLECNPRPNQICHLGEQIGINLSASLAAALHNNTLVEPRIVGRKIVPLFPQEWLRNEEAALDDLQRLDIPRNDPKLFNFMLRCGLKHGNSVEKLTSALNQSSGGSLAYTFV